MKNKVVQSLFIIEFSNLNEKGKNNEFKSNGNGKFIENGIRGESTRNR